MMDIDRSVIVNVVSKKADANETFLAPRIKVKAADSEPNCAYECIQACLYVVTYGTFLHLIGNIGSFWRTLSYFKYLL